ncbi:MAG: group II intron reverse transcriptase/maturase [Planctomycetota bacterium]|nr:MAG: group II intron reverse transcriptase/maturase [Planctomycetota bacterium]
MGDTQKSETVSTKLERIAEQARENPELVFISLVHLMDVDFLREAFHRLRKDTAPGIDGMMAKKYAENLDENLLNLHERLAHKKYRATPVKRVWLDEDDGKKRPIGITVLEDKIVQRAVAMLMGAVYEQDFYDFSYGFRQGRSPHNALHVLRERCMKMGIGWIIDLDVSGCFDNIEHGKLLDIIKQRINDGGIIRLIGKWLHAGVMEGEILSYSEKGTPQGGVISPLLANIYLHHVLDEWFEREVKPLMRGRVFIVRFADDAVIGCELEYDARRVKEVLPKRFGRYGLTVHPQKTKLVRFRKPRKEDDAGKNGTFDYLGFTHYWAKSRRGYWVIKRKTMEKRWRRIVKATWEWCRHKRHEPLEYQYKKLCQKLRGHFQYYAIRGNYRTLEKVREYVRKAWRYWLHRRSRKRRMTWERFVKLELSYSLPKPRIIHAI